MLPKKVVCHATILDCCCASGRPSWRLRVLPDFSGDVPGEYGLEIRGQREADGRYLRDVSWNVFDHLPALQRQRPD